MARLSDTSRAAIAGAALLGLASYAVFGFQHGFEEQIGWYLMLLPASVIAGGISDAIRKSSESESHFAFWSALLVLNFLWYFAISFAVIKGYRIALKLSRRG